MSGRLQFSHSPISSSLKSGQSGWPLHFCFSKMQLLWSWQSHSPFWQVRVLYPLLLHSLMSSSLPSLQSRFLSQRLEASIVWLEVAHFQHSASSLPSAQSGFPSHTPALLRQITKPPPRGHTCKPFLTVQLSQLAAISSLKSPQSGFSLQSCSFVRHPVPSLQAHFPSSQVSAAF